VGAGFGAQVGDGLCGEDGEPVEGFRGVGCGVVGCFGEEGGCCCCCCWGGEGGGRVGGGGAGAGAVLVRGGGTTKGSGRGGWGGGVAEEEEFEKGAEEEEDGELAEEEALAEGEAGGVRGAWVSLIRWRAGGWVGWKGRGERGTYEDGGCGVGSGGGGGMACVMLDG